MESLFALLLIMSPATDDACPASPALLMFVDGVARQLELTNGYVDIEGDLVSIELGEAITLADAQDRWRQMRNWPPCADVKLLPPRNTVVNSRTLNHEYRRSLTELIDLHPGWGYERHLDEAEQLYRLWDLADDAQSWRSVYERRSALQRIRELLGDDLYYSKSWPPSVPLWLFEE